MAILIDYPRAALKSSLEIAHAVDSFGGKCSADMAADKLNKKGGGAWITLLASAARYGLITNKRGTLELTQLFRDFKLAYSQEEANAKLVEAFLMPPLFQAIFDRFRGRELPITHFEKLLIREFKVPEAISSRVAKYFIEGAKQCGLLGANNALAGNATSSPTSPTESNEESSDEFQDEVDPISENLAANEISNQELIAEEGKFSIRIKGPGMDSLIVVNDIEDLIIIKAMIKKVEKKFPNTNDDSA